MSAGITGLQRETAGKTPYVTPAALPVQTLEPRLTPKLGLSRAGAIKAYRDAKTALIEGSLATLKAAYTAKVQFVAIASATQVVPEYRDLTASASIGDTTSDNTLVKTDKAWLTAVTAVYDLTSDPTRLTNLYSAFTRDNQTVTLTGAATVAHVLEVVGTAYPYQGCFGAQNPAAGSGLDPFTTIFEVVYWDRAAMLTTNGTGGTAASSTALDASSPLVPKLPLSGNAGTYKNVTFTSAGINYFASSASDAVPWMRENIPIGSFSSRPNMNNNQGGRFDPGYKFGIAGNAQERGQQTTKPALQLNLGQLTGSAPTNYLAVIFALVRVADLAHDNTNFPLGRLFLYVATQVQGAATVPLLQTSASVASACDVFHLSGDPDFFEGMRVTV